MSRRALVGPRGTANMTAVQGGGRNGGPSATKRPKPDEDLSNAGNVNVMAVRPWIPCEAVLHSKFVRCALEGADLGEEGQKALLRLIWPRMDECVFCLNQLWLVFMIFDNTRRGCC